MVIGSSSINPLNFGKLLPSMLIKLYKYFPFIFTPKRFVPNEYICTNGTLFILYLFSVNILSPTEIKVTESFCNLTPL